MLHFLLYQPGDTLATVKVLKVKVSKFTAELSAGQAVAGGRRGGPAAAGLTALDLAYQINSGRKRRSHGNFPRSTLPVTDLRYTSPSQAPSVELMNRSVPSPVTDLRYTSPSQAPSVELMIRSVPSPPPVTDLRYTSPSQAPSVELMNRSVPSPPRH